MISLMPADNLPRWISFSMDARFAAFCVAVTGAAALLFGLASGDPVLRRRHARPAAGFAAFGPRFRARGGRHYAALVVSEIGLALVLLISAGLLLKRSGKCCMWIPDSGRKTSSPSASVFPT